MHPFERTSLGTIQAKLELGIAFHLVSVLPHADRGKTGSEFPRSGGVPVDRLASRLRSLGARKHEEIVVCGSGSVPLEAARRLSALGYRKIRIYPTEFPGKDARLASRSFARERPSGG